jgi:hypothetical protein
MEKLKRFLWVVASAVVIAFVVLSLAAMWMVGQMPH